MFLAYPTSLAPDTTGPDTAISFGPIPVEANQPGALVGTAYETTTGGTDIAEVEYQYAPLRIFDLQPALDGEVSNINQPIGAWTADWRNLTHNHEVRWPYVFVSGYLDGLQIFDMRMVNA